MTHARGGEPVAGVQVRIYREQQDTEPLAVEVSNRNGIFRFPEEFDGSYFISAVHSGYAASTLQGVIEEGRYDPVPVVLQKPLSQDWPIQAPELSFTDIEDFAVIDGDVDFSYGVNFAGSLYPRFRYAGLGYDVSDWNRISSNTDDVVFDAATLPTGRQVVQVVVYDSNNNRSARIIPITIAERPHQSVPKLSAEDIDALLFRVSGENLRLFDHGDEYTVMLWEAIIAPPDGTLADAVILSVGRSSNGPFRYVGESRSMGADEVFWDTTFTGYTPGDTLYLRFQYIYQGVTGAGYIQAVPLPAAYSLRLASPADNAVIAGDAIQFTWDVGEIAGGYPDNISQEILIYTYTGELVFRMAVPGSQTALSIPVHVLPVDTLLRWDISSWVTGTYSDSRPKPGFGANNGPRYFTVSGGE
ncbi:carboxypeptidase-like regulatory domain-containing protein [Spirochaeta africana]|uniref:carboxypeptidase-like regulatory domain-containing protein n=1 Tax=Spirochaeta africana TaxID=46355 RepID=UPI00145C3FBB|nr:carboxypeptidase-like regulatory domain-containing protein [Spirochaeta africana]